MRIAILGGSFDPVHVGHLFLADTVISALKYDRVILIPAFRSPFKLGVDAASPRDRLDMLAASIAADPRLTIDECEIKREGVSYTIDTIAEITARYRPEGRPGLILGDDLAATFPQWKNAAEIVREADIILARRLFSATDPSAGKSPVPVFPYPFTALNNEVMNVSSALIREKIRRGENWRYLVPSGARCIITDRSLYRGSRKTPAFIQEGGISLETVLRIENDARSMLKPSRFFHSRNTALLARDLCVNYSLDPLAGYLAGISHDMCKSMKEQDLLRAARSRGQEISALEKKKPGLLHGKVAAVLLRERYLITDEEILDAVSSHVTCGEKMGDLAKVLYIADKIELSRDYVVPRLREMCGKAGLDELFAAVLEDTVAYLRSRQMDISDNARQLLLVMGETKKTGEKKKNAKKKQKLTPAPCFWPS